MSREPDALWEQALQEQEYEERKGTVMTTTQDHAGSPAFCWFCYSESIQRVAAVLDRPMRNALLLAAMAHRPEVPSSAVAHKRHAGARS